MAVKILKNLLVSASLGLCLQSAAFADESGSVAKISGAEGTVMVDHGKGFVSSKVGDQLFQDDRVITLDGSAAEIVFNDGCRTKLKSNNLIVVRIDPGCKAAILDATKGAPAGPLAALAFIPPATGAGIGVGFATWKGKNPISPD